MRIAVRVRPGASRERVGGSWEGPDGARLLVAVTARPDRGAATDAVLAAVADAFGLRRREVRLIAGGTSRSKLLELDVTEHDGVARLHELLAATR